MDINELKNSGLLELYVIGALDRLEQKQVEEVIGENPELKKELTLIERALEEYGQYHAIKPDSDVKAKIFNEIDGQKTIMRTLGSNNNRNFFWKVAAGILLVTGSILLTQIIGLNKENDSLKLALTESQTEIANLSRTNQQEREKYEALHDYDSRLLAMTATDNYSEGEIYLYSNPKKGKNFLELKSLPPISADQSYQLWSLKPGEDPIPLNVFQGDIPLLEVDFEEGTSTYAITIEPYGGQDQPTLEQLIGTFQVS